VIFGCFHAFGWDLGILESILCVIVVGFSVDFTIHLADGYVESDGDNDESNKINTDETAEAIRYRKVRGALAVTGVSIISGGVSTLLGTFSMMLATITFFSR
jgi:protein dispatched 1